MAGLWAIAEQTAQDRLGAEVGRAKLATDDLRAELREAAEAVDAADAGRIAAEAEMIKAKEIAAVAEHRAASAEAKVVLGAVGFERSMADERRQRFEAESDLRKALDRAVKAEAVAEERARMLAILTKADSKPTETSLVEELPSVPDRLKPPKAERAAYDDGVVSARTGRSKPSLRFQRGQRLAEKAAWWRAGFRDGSSVVKDMPVGKMEPEGEQPLKDDLSDPVAATRALA